MKTSLLPLRARFCVSIAGHGSHGTIVYKGTFSARPVAVKRMLAEVCACVCMRFLCVLCLFSVLAHSHLVRICFGSTSGARMLAEVCACMRAFFPVCVCVCVCALLVLGVLAHDRLVHFFGPASG